MQLYAFLALSPHHVAELHSRCLPLVFADCVRSANIYSCSILMLETRLSGYIWINTKLEREKMTSHLKWLS